MRAARASWTAAEMEGPRAEITLVTTWGIVGEKKGISYCYIMIAYLILIGPRRDNRSRQPLGRRNCSSDYTKEQEYLGKQALLGKP